MGFNYFKVRQPLQDDSLLCSNKFPCGLGNYLINLRKMKSWVHFGATQQL